MPVHSEEKSIHTFWIAHCIANLDCINPSYLLNISLLVVINPSLNRKNKLPLSLTLSNLTLPQNCLISNKFISTTLQPSFGGGTNFKQNLLNDSNRTISMEDAFLELINTCVERPACKLTAAWYLNTRKNLSRSYIR